MLTESTSNNTSMNINDDSSNSSNSQLQNVSFTTSPLPAPSVSKFSPQQPTSQDKQLPLQPPPLPPLPPSLVSKYGLNRTLNIEPQQTPVIPPPPQTQQQQNLELNNDQIDPAELKSDRQIKCTSTCSELDVFFKGFIQIKKKIFILNFLKFYNFRLYKHGSAADRYTERSGVDERWSIEWRDFCQSKS